MKKEISIDALKLFTTIAGMKYTQAILTLAGMEDKRAERFHFGSESVTPGHPDKLCDLISCSVLDYLLERDPNARVACEVAAMNQTITIGGEISSKSKLTEDELKSIVKNVLEEVGYIDGTYNYDTIDINDLIIGQSDEIAAGVDADEDGELGAGDQGMMIGGACNQTPSLMPAALYYSRKLTQELYERRKNAEKNDGSYGSLRPDAKAQIIFEYDKNRNPIRISHIVISSQHDESMSLEELRVLLKDFAAEILPSEYLNKDTKFVLEKDQEKAEKEITKLFFNPAGTFVTGGPEGDAGLTGRKIIVDTYGGWFSHGGGAFSGKDPTKVDRIGAYMARYIAKHVVAARLADECEVQLTFAIGEPNALSLRVDTKGTAKKHEQDISDAIRSIMPMTVSGIINLFDANRPIYAKAAMHGHFGHEPKDGYFPWEKTDKVDELRENVAKLDKQRKRKAFKTVTFGLLSGR
jgi:S-adenosylmethionine synthetase